MQTLHFTVLSSLMLREVFFLFKETTTVGFCLISKLRFAMVLSWLAASGCLLPDSDLLAYIFACFAPGYMYGECQFVPSGSG